MLEHFVLDLALELAVVLVLVVVVVVHGTRVGLLVRAPVEDHLEVVVMLGLQMHPQDVLTDDVELAKGTFRTLESSRSSVHHLESLSHLRTPFHTLLLLLLLLHWG